MKLKKLFKYIYPHCAFEILDGGNSYYFISTNPDDLINSQLKKLMNRKVKYISGDIRSYGDLSIELKPIKKNYN